MGSDYGSAEIKQRGGDIVIVAHAMLGAGRITDWESFNGRVAVSDDNVVLGAALRLCLLRSRSRPSEWMKARMRSPGYDARLAEAFGLTSARGLFSGMRNVEVDWSNDRVTLGPTQNRRGGRFDGFEGGDRGHEDVIVAFSSTDEDVAKAIREALRRCL